MDGPNKNVVLRDVLLPVVLVEIWPDGDVILKQGRDTIQISEAQVEKLIKSLSS